jgi:hypothetical protein
MVTQLSNTPDNMVGFRLTDTVTKDDYNQVIFPAVDGLAKKLGKLNYLLDIDTPLSNFTIGAWWKDAILGIKGLTKTHKVAVLTDSDGLNRFTNIVSVLVPGEFKGFKRKELDAAIEWVAAP